MTGPSSTSVGSETADIRRRFLILTAMRWLPTGLVIPVVMLVMVDRGLSLTQVGLASSAQGLLILALELPTGGLADTVGRQRVLVAATAVELVALALLAMAHGVWSFALAWGLLGIYRALESGPLASWFVDRVQAIDPDADIETGLARAGTASGLAIGVGSLACSGLLLAAGRGLLPAPGGDRLILPLALAWVLALVDLGAIATLMDSPPRTADPDHRSRPALGRLVAEARRTPEVVGQALHLVRRSRALRALISIEVLWGAGMVAFENFTPVRLGLLLDGADAGAAAYGGASVAGWMASAALAALVPALTRRFSSVGVAMALRVVQGVTVVGVGILAGPIGVMAAFVATMTVHGASNVVHQSLLHRAVIGPDHRATVLSANSMAASIGGIAGGIGLGLIADRNLTVAVIIGAALLAVAAPLYRSTVAPTGDGATV